jgi:hypothetical protein
VLDRYDLWAHSSHDGFSIDPKNQNWLAEWEPALDYASGPSSRRRSPAWSTSGTYGGSDLSQEELV